MSNNTDSKFRTNLKSLFGDIDSNHDGYLSEEEISAALHRLRLPTSPEQVKALLGNADENHDGRISFPEFEKFAVAHRSQLRTVFDEVDADRNGAIDKQELSGSLHRLGLAPSEVQVKALLHRIDQDDSGAIDFDEWCDFLIMLPATSVNEVFDYWQKAVALDIGQDFMVPPDVPPKSTSRPLYFAAGAAAGAVSRTATAPLDRVKIMLQCADPSQRAAGGLWQGLSKIWQQDGARGLFRGNGANVYKIMPESGIRFVAYETFKQRLFGPELSNGQKFIAGGMAGFVAQLTVAPMEVVRTRLAISPVGTYGGIADCFRQIYRSEGLPGIYRGVRPALMGIVPYAAIDLSVYDALKTLYSATQPSQQHPSIPVLLACGAISSTCAQLASYPLDLARRRLQSQGVQPGGPRYTGTLDVWRKTVQTDGWRGLYRGMGVNFVRVVPAVSISYTVYEHFKRYFNLA